MPLNYTTNIQLQAHLRHFETIKAKPLFADEAAVLIAGADIGLLADSYLKIFPDLQNFVASKIFHFTETIRQQKNNVKQVVFVGTGGDFPFYRNKELWTGLSVFEIDEAEIINERQQVETQFALHNNFLCSLTRINCVAGQDNITEKLLLHGYNIAHPTLFVYEGSWHREKKISHKVLSEISFLMGNNSLLWMDMLDETILNKENNEGKSFMTAMIKMGTPICAGFSGRDEVFDQNGLRVLGQLFASCYVKMASAVLASAYWFALLGNRMITNRAGLKNVVSKNREAFERLINKTSL